MALAHQLVERIGPSRYGTPTETTRISWIVDAVIDGSLRNRMERAILGIVAVGRPGFHRIDDYLTGVFYDNPAARDGLVEHVLANVWVNAFRGPRPNEDLDWLPYGKEAGARLLQEMAVIHHIDLENWLTELLGMERYASQLVPSPEAQHSLERIVRKLRQIDLDLFAPSPTRFPDLRSKWLIDSSLLKVS